MTALLTLRLVAALLMATCETDTQCDHAGALADAVGGPATVTR